MLSDTPATPGGRPQRPRLRPPPGRGWGSAGLGGRGPVPWGPIPGAQDGAKAPEPRGAQAQPPQPGPTSGSFLRGTSTSPPLRAPPARLHTTAAPRRPPASLGPQTYSKTCSEVQIFMVPAACAVSGRRKEAKRPRRPPPRPLGTRPAPQRARAVGPDAGDVPTHWPAPYPGPGLALDLRAAQRNPAP